MARRAIDDLPREWEPPKRKRNFLRAFLIVVGAGIVAGVIVLVGLLYLPPLQDALAAHTPSAQAQPQQKQTQVIEKTVYVRQERLIPYPDTPEEAAEQFGGDPSGWYLTDDGGWLYHSSDESIELTVGRNVTYYTDHALFYWE